MKYFWWTSTLLLVLALSPMSVAQDPCASGVKSSKPFFINTGNFQQVIPAVAGMRIFICNVVFSGSAASGFNINFAGSSSDCNSGFTFLGSLFLINKTAVTAGGGSSTQFALPSGNSFCIELGGVTPLQSSGWVVYVRRLG